VDMIKELMSYSLNVHTIDPHASPNEVAHEYGISLIDAPVGKYDAIVLAVGHQQYKVMTKQELEDLANGDLLLFDIKGIKGESEFNDFWKL